MSLDISKLNKLGNIVKLITVYCIIFAPQEEAMRACRRMSFLCLIKYTVSLA